MKSVCTCLFWIALAIGGNPALAFKRHTATGENKTDHQNRGLDFIENKGQWNKQVRFKAELNDGVVFLTDSGFVYHFVQTEDLQGLRDAEKQGQSVIRTHAYRVHVAGSLKDASYKKKEKRQVYHNYFTSADQADWKGHVGLFGSIERGQIYKGIDLVVYSKDYHLKYDFKVAAGADVSQIKLVYEGVVPELTAEGHLRIKTSVNEIIEQAPYCYQVVGGKEHKVRSRYQLHGQTVTFSFPDGYDTTRPLVIDPELVYATYSGSVIPSGIPLYRCPEAHATTYDHNGMLYAAVAAYNLGWPVTLGAVQATYTPGLLPAFASEDVGINVYNANGTQLVYSTYFGGNSNDLPFAMIVNDENELILTGGTSSTAGFPLTGGCYDNSYAGGTSSNFLGGLDLYIAHFTSDGASLIGCTLLGGSGSELIPSANNMTQNQPGFIRGDNGHNTGCPLNLTLDQQGNIWIIANTESTNFPVTANAQQPVYGGGPSDMVLCKLNPLCSQLLYSSYLGGNALDLGYGILFNHAGNLVICGGTKSLNFPVTPGSLHPVAPGGDFDGFIAIINPANGTILKSTYLGTAAKDQAIMIAVDEQDHVYTMGNTYGNYPVTTGTFAMAGGDVFLHKLSADLGSSLASTTLGGPLPSRLRPAGFTFTDCGEVLLSAAMDVTQAIAMPCTSGAIMSDSAQFWFCTMPPDFSSLNYASYYGPELILPITFPVHHLYWATGINRYDPAGVMYHSFSCFNNGFPTTPASWAPVSVLTTIPPISGGVKDVASFKIAFGFNADFILDVNANDSGCAPYTVQFSNTSSGANAYTWDFGDGSPVSNLAIPPPHMYVNPGTYIVALYAANDTACVTGDTAFLPITVVAAAVQPDITAQDTLLCGFTQAMDISVQINNPNPGFDIVWTPPPGILSPPDQATITVNPTLNTVFHVTVTDDRFGLCSASATDSITITLMPNPLDILTPDTTVCGGTTIWVAAVGNPLYTYRWIPSAGLSDSTILQPAILVLQPENYTLLATYPGCPDTAVFLNIGMHEYPHVYLGNDKSVCPGVEVPLESMVTPYRNDYLYNWTPATANLSNPHGPNTHYTAETTMTYTLTVQSPIGCSGADSIVVTVFPAVNGSVTADTGYCSGGQIPLEAAGGTRYSWSPAYGLSDTTVANPIADPGTSTSYVVVISNVYHCTDTQNVNVQVYSNAILNMPDSVNVYPGEPYFLEPGTNCHYFTWFPPSGISDIHTSTPTFYPEVRTRYFVTALTEHGCEIKDSIDVLVKETVIDMPNAFNPSGDNKLFRPSKRGIAQLKGFTIFNRWGNKVYSSTNIDEGWDGTFNGTPQPLGVYVYVIEAVTDKGRVFTKQGNVTLVR